MGNTDTIRVKMQATAEARLDQVAQVMSALGPIQPGDSPKLRKRRRAGRRLFTKQAVSGGWTLGQMKEVEEQNTPTGARSEFATSRARQIRRSGNLSGSTTGATYRPNTCRKSGNWGETNSLKGLLSMMVLYIKMGEEIGDSASYPKAIAPLMARTDFAHLFRMLPPRAKDALPHAARFVAGAFGAAAGLPLDQPIIDNNPHFQTDLTRALWAEYIPGGLDLFTQRGYQLLVQSRHPNVAQGGNFSVEEGMAFANDMGQAPWLEGLGSYGARKPRAVARPRRRSSSYAPSPITFPIPRSRRSPSTWRNT